MKQRTITGAILFAVLAPLIIFDLMSILFQIVMGCFVVAASFELLKMYESEKKYSLPIKLMIVGCSVLMYSTILTIANSYECIYNFTPLFTTLLLIIVAMTSVSVFGNFDGRDVVKGLFITLYSGLGIAALVMLRLLNVDFIIYLLLITTMTDIFAYFGGVLFGKNKMAPTISPKKTWEGAIIGSVFGTVVATCFALFFGVNNPSIFTQILPGLNSIVLIPAVILLTLAATILGQIGDLVASKLKRTYDIKDFGKIFPGHGGVLDRFDSAIFVSMFLLAIILIL